MEPDDEEEDVEDNDGQPDEYTEWQDYMGGDDWDHGQFDWSHSKKDRAKNGFGDAILIVYITHNKKEINICLFWMLFLPICFKTCLQL